MVYLSYDTDILRSFDEERGTASSPLICPLGAVQSVPLQRLRTAVLEGTQTN